MEREHSDIDRVVAFARPTNLASCRVLEKAAMTPVGRRTVNDADHAFYEWRRTASP